MPVKREVFESRPIQITMDILESGIMRAEFGGLGGYDVSDMRKIAYVG